MRIPPQDVERKGLRLTRTEKNLRTPIASFCGVKVYTGCAGYFAGTERVEIYRGVREYQGHESVETDVQPGKRPTAGRIRAMRWGRG